MVLLVLLSPDAGECRRLPVSVPFYHESNGRTNRVASRGRNGSAPPFAGFGHANGVSERQGTPAEARCPVGLRLFLVGEGAGGDLLPDAGEVVVEEVGAFVAAGAGTERHGF